MNPKDQHLQPTPIIDSDHESVQAFTHQYVGSSGNPVDQAVSLYFAVRDGIRYNPYKFELSVDGLKASTTLAVGEAWCVPKAALLAACCRVMGIPSRVGYADVRNHLSTKRMREQMKTDIFHWHGYTSIHLDGKWIKATPAFNIELCEKFRLRTLDFDGQNDSIYHPFDLDGNKHMDYILFRGEYDDVPLEEIRETFKDVYSGVSSATEDINFQDDVNTETASVSYSNRETITMKKKDERTTTESSMSIASKPFCQEEECIGKVASPDSEGSTTVGKDKEEDRLHRTRSSMKFGKDDGCRDEECIGES